MSQTPPRYPSDPARREALKAALLARHGRLYPIRTARAHPWLPRAAMAAALGVLLLVSFAAPAEHEVEVGRRITVVTAAGSPPPDHKLFLPLLEQLGQTREIQLVARREKDGPLTLQVEMWGARLAPDAAERLRAGIPGLKDAQITEEPLRGRARTRVLVLLGRKLFGFTDDPAQIAAARAALQAELAARGEDGRVDIEVERGEDGRKKVRATVKSVKTEVREAPPEPEAK